MEAIVSVRYVAKGDEYGRNQEYATFTYTFDGPMDSRQYDEMMDAIITFYDAIPESVGVLNIFRPDEKPADVRMSAESLIELQRVAASRAVIAFAELEYNDREYGRIREDAQHFADQIAKGEIKW